MRIRAERILVFLICIFICTKLPANKQSVVIKWKPFEIAMKGKIKVSNGKMTKLFLLNGKGMVDSSGVFLINPHEEAEISVMIDSTQLSFGPGSTVISVNTNIFSFSFFLRDITKLHPVYIPDPGIIVSEGSDTRSYFEIEKDIQSRQWLNKAEKIELQPETSFESIAHHSRDMSCPVWLGLGGDIRLFQIYEEMNDNDLEGKAVKPILSTTPIKLPEVENDELTYFYTFGRGVGTHPNVTRSLEDGFIPIYHSKMIDDDIHYHSMSFVTGEIHHLSQLKIEGTDYRVFDYYSTHRKTDTTTQKTVDELLIKESEKEGLVLCINTTIRNKGNIPRYAWFMIPRPGTGWGKQYPHHYDRNNGISSFSDNKVYCVAKLNGEAIPNEEMAILLQPGEVINCQFIIPHHPITKERGEALSNRDFSNHYPAAKSYWKKKMEKTAQIHLPERRIEEMLKAGLFHLDLITFGDNNSTVYAPNIGVYSPIGTESAPVILYYLSMGYNDIAKKSLNYFLATQQSDGSIQNYGGYMVETGAVLWIAGEYVRYTKDSEWLIEKKNQLVKACEYLINWRNLHKIDSLRGRGYGMVDGKFADVSAPFRQFSVNAYNYLGLSRMAESLYAIDPEKAVFFEKEAMEWKKDIWESINYQLAITPVVPLGNGTWTSTLSPWAEGNALRALYHTNETFWSHGTFIDSDILSGPLYLIFCEVIDPESHLAGQLLEYTREIFCQEMTAFSQPYYSRHNWIQLQRREVKQFLRTYYGTVAAQADRQTYSFWEHMYRVTPHKTHEEATFLMETRWMLYLEKNDTLSVFQTIPRKWLEGENSISLKGVQSYFGKLNIHAQSNFNNGNRIKASVSCEDIHRKPKSLIIRLPHPKGNKPIKVVGGIYNPQDESILISNFTGNATVSLQYEP